jgi:hypothetical protein
MGQRENKEEFLRLLCIVKGCAITLEQITSNWVINPDANFLHDTELSGKVVSGNTVSVNDYYPLVQYPLGDQLDRRTTAET